VPVPIEDIRLYSRPEQVDQYLWERLSRLAPEEVVRTKGAVWTGRAFRVEMLGQTFEISPEARSIEGPDRQSGFQEALVLLQYLSAPGPGGLSGRRISFRELKGGDLFFNNIHRLSTDDLAAELNLSESQFLEAGRRLGGRETGTAEYSWLVLALPQIPLEAIYFPGDDEFEPRLTLLVDAAAGSYLELDVLWALVNLLARRIRRLTGREH